MNVKIERFIDALKRLRRADTEYWTVYENEIEQVARLFETPLNAQVAIDALNRDRFNEEKKLRFITSSLHLKLLMDSEALYFTYFVGSDDNIIVYISYEDKEYVELNCVEVVSYKDKKRASYKYYKNGEKFIFENVEDDDTETLLDYMAALLGRQTMDMLRFSFAQDAVMYHGFIKVGDVEVIFDSDDYSMFYVNAEGEHEFVFSEPLCRYISRTYFESCVNEFAGCCKKLSEKGAEFEYKFYDNVIKLVGCELYVNGDLIEKSSGIPDVIVGRDVFDAEFFVIELYQGFGYGVFRQFLNKLRKYVESLGGDSNG